MEGVSDVESGGGYNAVDASEIRPVATTIVSVETISPLVSSDEVQLEPAQHSSIPSSIYRVVSQISLAYHKEMQKISRTADLGY